MTTTDEASAEIDRFNQLDVEGFTLSDGKGATRHFERDHDLDHKTRKALGGGTQKAVLLVTLGLDEYDFHRVQLDYYAGNYSDPWEVVHDAIETLVLIRDQLGEMHSTPDAREFNHNALRRGTGAEKAGPAAAELRRVSES